jgi:hypothetical protein
MGVCDGIGGPGVGQRRIFIGSNLLLERNTENLARLAPRLERQRHR